jgi:hypothetical protein
MIFQYAILKNHPTIFRAVTGLSLSEFDEYVEPLIIELAQQEKQALDRRQRQRAVGGGRRHELDWREQFLLSLIWLKLYPTYEVLGYFFHISDSSAHRIVVRCLPVLAATGRRELQRSQRHAGQKRGYHLEAIFDQVPGLAVIVDAFEQAIEKPRQRQEADGYYSGKKQHHTLKSQVTVDAYTGEVLDVAESEPGRSQDKGYFNRSGTPDRLPPETAFLADLGYPGLAKELPLAAIPRKKPRAQPRPEADKAFNKLFASIRIVVEHTIARLRSYQALAVRDRHHRHHHTSRVLAVSGLVNFTKRSRFVY